MTREDVQANIILLHKTGDTQDPNNYRPISLLNTDYKITTKVINTVVKSAVGHVIPEEQMSRAEHHQKGNATDPTNYHPIALLNVDYKLLSKTVLELLRDALPPTLILKQQLTRSNVSGTLHGFLIDKAVTRGATMRGREHHTARRSTPPRTKYYVS